MFKVGGARWLMFNAVGAAGLLVQLACLWVLRDGLGVHYLVAACAAIELTIVHNFLWHVRWSWADRPSSTAELVRRLVRFNLTNGAISILGNLGLMAALVELATMHYLLANVLSVGACSLANFVVSDVVVFMPGPAEPPGPSIAHRLLRRRITTNLRRDCCTHETRL